MIFSHHTESIQYNPYILDIPIGKNAVGHIYINQDAIEDILTDLLALDEGESFYIKRDGNKYLCNIEGKTGYGFCVFSLGEALIKLLRK